MPDLPSSNQRIDGKQASEVKVAELDLKQFLADRPKGPRKRMTDRGPTLKAWCILLLATLTAPIWLPIGFLWTLLRALHEAIGDALFRFRFRKELRQIPNGSTQPRYCMRVERADGTEMHFLLSKEPKDVWVREKP